MTPEQAAKVLDKLVLELQNRADVVDTLDKAYRGEFRLKFASDDFRDFFADRYAGFSDNWTQVVADAPHERLEVTGIRLPEQDKGDDELWETWLRNEADYFSDLALLDAIIAKRAYALVWADADGEPQVTFEHPGQAVVAYDPETRKRRFGAKVWVEDEIEYATLYTPDEIWKFERPRTTPDTTYEVTLPTSYTGGWTMRLVGDEPWPLPNPIGEVPLVELPNKPRLIGEPMSDISGTLSMQHAINILWAELFVAADFLGLPGRVITGAEMPVVPILNELGEVVGTKPVDLKQIKAARTLWLEGDAKIDEWSAAQLDNFTGVIDKAVGHIASQTRTPAHYLMNGGTFANISADAMKALETGLVMRTKEKTQSFGRGIREVFRLFALIQKDTGKADAISRATILWRDIENRSDAQLTDSLQKKAAMGYPFEYVLELDGQNPREIQRILDMRDAEANDPTVARLLQGMSDDAALGA